uniref:Uncharacterized protein n=1 Tax=Gadus morhua TaxID=8049 RepID=A0A8C5CF38_GADMO
MPKEQGHFGERVGRSTSKNAKDRSNSATVRADRGRRTQAGPGDSEKDSGYSGEPVLLPEDVFFVLLWLLLSLQEQMLHRQLASWAGGWHSISGPQGPSLLLEIQQPAVTAPSSSTLTTYLAPVENLSKANKKGCTSRTSGKNHHSSTKNSYLPIPHPRKEGHAQGKSAGAPAAGQEGGGGGVGGEDQSHCKRMCTEDELKKESVSTTTRHLKSHCDLFFFVRFYKW